MKTIAVISDTHIPSETQQIPKWICFRIRDADYTIHAGDFETSSALEYIENISTNLIAVRGNWDPSSLDLPTVAVTDILGVRFVVSHGTTGQKNDYQKRIATLTNEHADSGTETIGIAGHTHKVMNTTIDGVQLLNPGSATATYPARYASMQLITIDGEDLSIDCLVGTEKGAEDTI